MDGSVERSPERFVVEKQDGDLVWGTAEYQNPDGSGAKERVTGTFIDGGKGIVLTECAAPWQGEVTGTTMQVTVSSTTDPSHGAFQMTLARQ